MRIAVSVLLLAAMVLPSAALAKESPQDALKREGAIMLSPTNDWNIDYGADRCQLTREFGSGSDRHLLKIDQTAPQGSFDLTLGGPEIRRFSTARRFWIGLRDDQPMWRYDRPGRATLKGFGPAVILQASFDKSDDSSGFKSAAIATSESNDANRIVLRLGGKVVSFETGQMTGALEAMNDCTLNLIQSWGLDPALHKKYQPPKLSNYSLIAKQVAAAYPRKARLAGQSATFKMLLFVADDGSVSDCRMLKTTLADRLDSPACTITMRHAKFDPARSESGEPMRSFYSISVDYSLR